MAISYPQIVTSMDLLQSTIRLDRLSSFLVTQHVQLAAITNTTLYGVQPFYTEMLKHHIQPVIGLRFKLEAEGQLYTAISYAKTEHGWKNLLKLSSAIETKHVDAVPLKWFQAYSSGLLTTIEVDPSTEEAVYTLFSASTIPAVSRGTVLDIEFMKKLRQSYEFIMPYAPAQIETNDDQLAFQVITALHNGKKLQEVGKTAALALMTASEWKTEFSILGEWDRKFYEQFPTTFSVVQSRPMLPRFPLKEGISAADQLKHNAKHGLSRKLPQVNTSYSKRLERELQIITQMGYSDYFLIVEDFIRHARAQGISVGPGRGSSASSLVAYALDITLIDPLEYGLLFERFLNPERVSLPDIDVDFADYRRDEVIRYVQQKYGAQHVAQILAYGTLSTKAVAREVARVMELPQEILAFLSKTIPSQSASLEEAVQKSQDLQAFVQRDQKHQLWFDLARRLEGMPRNTTVHAAGVVISPVPLVDVVPIEEHQDGMFLTQWTMKEVEAAGLLKMDFLGLRNLSTIEQIIQQVRRNENDSFQLETIPLDDSKTLQLLASADTLGIFQFESPGMRKALRLVEPSTFREVVAVNALFRPGPMAFIPNFAARKKGQEKVTYPHPDLENILKETYGIIVYQEQIMQIARVVGNYSYAEADILRRAISKKDRHILEQEKQQFISKAQQNNFPVHVASSIYDLIVRFAEYGFPKSHATAYSLIAFQMAYLKAHYPLSFYAALLSSFSGNRDKQVAIYREMKRQSVEILPPDLWRSSSRFTVECNAIRIGLSSIAGFPRNFMTRFWEIRKQKQTRWKSLFELAGDLSAHYFTRPYIEPLIKSGALDFLGKDRAVLLASLDPAIMHAELVRPSDQDDLFATETNSFGEPKYTEAKPMPIGYKLQFEKEVLGTYITTHPVEVIRQQQSITGPTLDQLNSEKGRVVEVVGLVKEIRKIRTKKGQAMAFAKFEDDRDEIELTLFPETFANVNVNFKENSLVRIKGKVEDRNGNLQLIVQTLVPL